MYNPKVYFTIWIFVKMIDKCQNSKKIRHFHDFCSFFRLYKMANINQLMRRQSSRELVHRQFSKDIDSRLEMSMMGDFYHGRRIHYSGGSFKMRARSKSEVLNSNTWSLLLIESISIKCFKIRFNVFLLVYVLHF